MKLCCPMGRTISKSTDYFLQLQKDMGSTTKRAWRPRAGAGVKPSEDRMHDSRPLWGPGYRICELNITRDREEVKSEKGTIVGTAGVMPNLCEELRC